MNFDRSPFKLYGKVHKLVFLALFIYAWGNTTEEWWVLAELLLSTPRATGMLMHFGTGKCSCFRNQTLVINCGVCECAETSGAGSAAVGPSLLCNVVFDIVLIKPHVLTNTCGENYPGPSTCCWAWLQIVDGDNSEMKPFQAVVSSAAAAQPCLPQYLLNTCCVWAALRAVSCTEPPKAPAELSGSERRGNALVHKL